LIGYTDKAEFALRMDSPRSETAPPSATLHTWFSAEVQPHDASLKAYLRSAFPGVRDVDDVAQESYLQLWRTRAREPIRSARALLFKVARQLAIDLVRRERVAPVTPVADLAQLAVADSARGVADAIEAEEKFRLVAEAVLALPPRCRDAVVLYRLKNLSRAEVAARLGIAEKTVDEQVARGSRRIEKFLRARGVTEFGLP